MVCPWHCWQRGGCWHTESTSTTDAHTWYYGKGGMAVAHTEPIPQPWVSGAVFVPKAQGFALQPCSPTAPSHHCALPIAGTAFSFGDQNSRNSAGDEKKNQQPKVPLKANYHWQVCAVIGLGLYQIFPFAEA